MSDALIRTLAVTFALHPGMAARLLSEHCDDGSGRCRVCTAGGQGIRQRWPCPIHWYASRAVVFEEEAHEAHLPAPAHAPSAGARDRPTGIGGRYLVREPTRRA